MKQLKQFNSTRYPWATLTVEGLDSILIESSKYDIKYYIYHAGKFLPRLTINTKYLNLYEGQVHFYFWQVEKYRKFQERLNSAYLEGQIIFLHFALASINSYLPSPAYHSLTGQYNELRLAIKNKDFTPESMADMAKFILTLKEHDEMFQFMMKDAEQNTYEADCEEPAAYTCEFVDIKKLNLLN